MANIRIDTDGLQNNISSMRAYVNELDSLNARTQSLLAQIASSWEGEASTAYININFSPIWRMPGQNLFQEIRKVQVLSGDARR